MTDSVYILTKHIDFEDTDILGVFEQESDALEELEESYDDSQQVWSTGGDHIKSVRNRDTVYVVERFEVQ